MAENGQKPRKRGKENADEKILVALSCGATAGNAAREANVSVRTVERRLTDPAFRARLHRLRGETLERAGGALTAASLRAVQTLLSLQEPSQPPAVPLGAARAVLEIGLKVREVMEVALRMDAIEARIEGLNRPPN
jgi:hypothetical protein